jgi:hypothetical protein
MTHTFIKLGAPTTGGLGAIYNPTPNQNAVIIDMNPSTQWSGYTLTLTATSITRTFHVSGDVGTGPNSTIMIWIDASDSQFLSAASSGISVLTVSANDSGITDTFNGVSISNLYHYSTGNVFSAQGLTSVNMIINSNFGDTTISNINGQIMSMSGYLLSSTGTIDSTLQATQLSNSIIFDMFQPYTGQLQLNYAFSDESNAINLASVVVPAFIEVAGQDNFDNTVTLYFDIIDGQGGVTANRFTVSDSNGGPPITFVSGNVYPTSFIGGLPVTFTVTAFDENNVQIASATTIVTLLNAPLTIELTASSPPGDFNANISVSVIEDTSHNQFLTSEISNIELRFQDGSNTLGNVIWNGSPSSSITTGILRAGNIDVYSLIYFKTQGAPTLEGPSIEVDIPGMNSSIQVGVRSVYISWSYYDTFGIHSAPVHHVVATLTDVNNALHTGTINSANADLTLSDLPVGTFSVSVAAYDENDNLLSTGLPVSGATLPTPQFTGVTSSVFEKTIDISWMNPDLIPLYGTYDSIDSIEILLTSSSGNNHRSMTISSSSESVSFTDLPADTYTFQINSTLNSSNPNFRSYPFSYTGADELTVLSDTLIVTVTGSGSSRLISWVVSGPNRNSIASYNVEVTYHDNSTATYTTSDLSYSLSGLSIGDHSTTVTAFNDLGTQVCTGGSVFRVSDTNNGPIGHNPMSASLYFEKPDYSASASMSVDITLIGQTQAPLDKDQTIVVSVPLASLNDSLEVTAAAGWNLAKLEGPDSAQKYPNVIFKPASLVAAALADAEGKTAEDRFVAPNSGTGADASFADDAASAGLQSLQAYMNAITDADFPVSDFQKIPLEAVKSVDRKELACDRLSVVLGAPVPSLSTEESADNDWALRLFEQAAAAGKVVDEDKIDRTVGTPSFAAGDSISVYVQYNLNKTRKYLLDGDAAPRAAFKVGNVIIDPSDGQEEETSSAVMKVVEWKFTAAAPA